MRLELIFLEMDRYCKNVIIVGYAFNQIIAYVYSVGAINILKNSIDTTN
jgi:hypothetical protein